MTNTPSGPSLSGDDARCSTTQWSANTLRLAGVMGVTLAPQPRDEPNATVHREIYALDGTYAEARSAAAEARHVR
jgi:hypothetical protein